MNWLDKNILTLVTFIPAGAALLLLFAPRRDRLAQLGTARPQGPSGEGRRRQLLHVHLHQLAPDAPVRARLG